MDPSIQQLAEQAQEDAKATKRAYTGVFLLITGAFIFDMLRKKKR